MDFSGGSKSVTVSAGKKFHNFYVNLAFQCRAFWCQGDNFPLILKSCIPASCYFVGNSNLLQSYRYTYMYIVFTSKLKYFIVSENDLTKTDQFTSDH